MILTLLVEVKEVILFVLWPWAILFDIYIYIYIYLLDHECYV
jgi:hypothetical protein